MRFQSDIWKNGILTGAIGGAIWGVAALCINMMTGAFSLEASVPRNLVTFAVGGVIFGIVVSGFLALLKDFLPFKSIYAKAVLLSFALWLILRIGGALLSSIESERYHVVTSQSVQGFALAIIMGCILGLLWKLSIKKES